MPDRQEWRDRRREAASAHADALVRRQADESARARTMLADFVTRARAQALEPVPLRARSYDGRHRYRTDVTGWYLKLNETVAVGTDGQFYVLSVPSSLRALLRGATLDPSDPPLVLGKGGRDGESIDLADAIALVLARGATG